MNSNHTPKMTRKERLNSSFNIWQSLNGSVKWTFYNTIINIKFIDYEQKFSTLLACALVAGSFRLLLMQQMRFLTVHKLFCLNNLMPV